MRRADDLLEGAVLGMLLLVLALLCGLLLGYLLSKGLPYIVLAGLNGARRG